MITEEQADKIIDLLEKIEANTSNVDYYISDLSTIRSDVEDIKSALNELNKD